MDYRLIVVLWAVLSISLVYWDMNRHNDTIPLSDCHLAGITMIHDRPMCTECKLFCEVKK